MAAASEEEIAKRPPPLDHLPRLASEWRADGAVTVHEILDIARKPKGTLASANSMPQLMPQQLASSGGRERNLRDERWYSPTPAGTRGSEWAKSITDGFLFEGVALSMSVVRPQQVKKHLRHSSSTSNALGVTTSPRKKKMAPSPSWSELRPSTSAASLGLGARARFTARSTPDVYTPRRIATAEARMQLYLAERAGSASSTSLSLEAGGGLERGVSEELLRELWTTQAAPLALAVAPTAINDEMLVPLTEDAAIDVLVESCACTSMSAEALRHLVRVGTRRSLPKYAVAMREGALGSSVFIVLQGRLEASASTIERQAGKRQEMEEEHSGTGGDRGSGSSASEVSVAVKTPSMIFGELGLLLSVPRERTVVALETTELLSINHAQLAELPRSVAAILHSNVTAAFTSSALKSIPFFSTLPALTRRQLSALFELDSFDAGDLIARQGDPGDCMYVVLHGKVDIWRHRRGGKDKIASYTGLSPFPWFGELMQWVNDHGRAGDVVVEEDSLMLALRRAQVDEFVMLAPGFKALSMSYATTFQIKSVRVRDAAREREELLRRTRRGSTRPLRFALQWARMVSKLLGIGGMSSVALLKVEEVRRKALNSMEWVEGQVKHEAERVEARRAAGISEDGGDDGDARDAPLEGLAAQQRKLLEMAHAKKLGDSRTLADASNRAWRRRWQLTHRVRTEMLREAASSGEMAEQRRILGERIAAGVRAAVGSHE